MLFSIIAALGLLTPMKCALPFKIAENEAAARSIAQVVIASAPPEPIDKNTLWYDLHVVYLAERDSWLIYQRAISAVDGIRIIGGNGLGMEIAACDGAVSDIRRQR